MQLKKNDISNASAYVTLNGIALNDTDYSKAIIALQGLRDFAWKKALKYRFDPVIGKMHDEYLTMLNDMVQALK